MNLKEIKKLNPSNTHYTILVFIRVFLVVIRVLLEVSIVLVTVVVEPKPFKFLKKSHSRIVEVEYRNTFGDFFL